MCQEAVQINGRSFAANAQHSLLLALHNCVSDPQVAMLEFCSYVHVARLPQVKEPLLVRDVLYACQGIEGKFTQYQDGSAASMRGLSGNVGSCLAIEMP